MSAPALIGDAGLNMRQVRAMSAQLARCWPSPASLENWGPRGGRMIDNPSVYQDTTSRLRCGAVPRMRGHFAVLNGICPFPWALEGPHALLHNPRNSAKLSSLSVASGDAKPRPRLRRRTPYGNQTDVTISTHSESGSRHALRNGGANGLNNDQHHWQSLVQCRCAQRTTQKSLGTQLRANDLSCRSPQASRKKTKGRHKRESSNKARAHENDGADVQIDNGTPETKSRGLKNRRTHAFSERAAVHMYCAFNSARILSVSPVTPLTETIRSWTCRSRSRANEQ